MKKIYIILLKFNGEKEIKRCLESLQLIKLPKKWQVKVLVVENSSYIKYKISNIKYKNYKLKIKVIKNKKNLGFAGGMNVGTREALKDKAQAVLLLNQDTQVEKNFLPPLLENSADIVAPVIKFRRQGKWVYDYGGKVDWGLGKTKHIEKWQMTKTPTGDKWQIDYVSGCAMLIRRPVLEKIGLLDERYFLYFEDADFCLRARRAGFKIAVEPKSVVIHHLKEGKKKPLRQRWQIVKSNLIFINRWIVWWRRPLAWLDWGIRGVKILIG